MLSAIPVPRTDRAPGIQTRSSWLQVASHLDPAFGGIAAALPDLCRWSEREGVHSPVLGWSLGSVMERERFGRQSDVYVAPYGRMRSMWDPLLRSRMKRIIRQSDGVHVHGIWEHHCATAAHLARACKRPYMISAHGMLDRWALRQKRWKKALYATLIETGSLRHATCLRALTLAELEDYRRIGLMNPVAVIPNAVNIGSIGSPEPFLEANPELAGKRLFLYLGRLHEKKGLPLLLRAWASVCSPDAHLVIAGPDSDGTVEQLRSLIAELRLHERVSLVGMLTGSVKRSALSAASFFVLPSYSEGLSVALLEALAAGLPVIVTSACNMPEITQAGCGWTVEPNERELETALREASVLSGFEADGLGQRALTLARSRFDWPVVGKMMSEVYGWMLGGPRPACVDVCR